MSLYNLAGMTLEGADWQKAEISVGTSTCILRDSCSSRFRWLALVEGKFGRGLRHLHTIGGRVLR